MTLNKYLATASITAADFGILVGLSGASMSRIRKGEQNITLDLAGLIEDKSGGKVRVADLLQTRKLAA